MDGRRLGRIIDLVFSSGSGEICGIIVPFSRKAVFFKSRDVFIPWECVTKIGEDVIIVELNDFCGKPTKKNEPIRCSPPPKPKEQCSSPPEHGCGESKSPPPCNDAPSADSCDHRCEKCMLFDCEQRWSEQVNGGDGSGVYVDKNYYRGQNGRL